MDAETLTWAGVGAVIIAGFGKWIVPLLGRLLENATATARASGDVLATVQAERDQWKKQADLQTERIADLLEKWADMKAKFDLLQYQLQEATELNTKLLEELKVHRESKDA